MFFSSLLIRLDFFLSVSLANKHGIFDQQSLSKDSSNLSQSFTIISSRTNPSQDQISSPSSDIVNQIDENETELSSLQQQMNGVIPGSGGGGDDDDDEDDSTNHLHRNFHEDDDEQDGSAVSTSLINLPQQIASILANENPSMTT